MKPKDLQNIFDLLDGHWKLTNISEAVQLARASGVIMLSMPGHDSYRLQPLGVGFLRPANSHYEAEKYEMVARDSREISQSGKCENVVFLSSTHCDLFQLQLFFTYRMNNPVACSVQLASNLSQDQA